MAGPAWFRTHVLARILAGNEGTLHRPPNSTSSDAQRDLYSCLLPVQWGHLGVAQRIWTGRNTALLFWSYSEGRQHIPAALTSRQVVVLCVQRGRSKGSGRVPSVGQRLRELYHCGGALHQPYEARQ